MENYEEVEDRKATFYVSEVVQNSVLKRRGIACSVFFKGENVLVTSSSVVGATDKQKELIAERFSSSHVDNHRLDVSFDRQLDNFTFLKIDKEYSDGRTGRSWPIYVNLESATHEKKGLAKPFYGNKSQFKLQFEGVGSSTTIEVISKSTVETTSIIGAPIIIENTQVKKKHSGRISVIGVVGLTSKGKLCLCYWDDNTRRLDSPLSSEDQQSWIIYGETSAPPDEAMPAMVGVEGPSAMLETEEQRSWRLPGETSAPPDEAMPAMVGVEGPSAMLETEEQRSWRLPGDSRMASVSVGFATTQENTNFARLCRLLIDVGCSVLRDYFHSIHPPANLHVILSSPSVSSTLNSLLRKGVLTPLQWEKLFPAVASTVSSANFDITLLVVLLRNVCGLGPPASTGTSDKLPRDSNTSIDANIERIRFYRSNVISHALKASIDDPTFNELWQKISSAILALASETNNWAMYATSISRLKTECMDPAAEADFLKLLSEWKKDHDSSKGMLQELGDSRMASVSVGFATTHENTNFARLCRLLIDVGCTVLRDYFDSIHPPANLHVVLSSPSVSSTLNALLRKGVLTPLQWEKLFPAVASTVSSANFDITLLVVLLRNVCGLGPPASTGTSDKLPRDSNTSIDANIERIRFYRSNVISHALKASIDDPTFNELWQKISSAILALASETNNWAMYATSISRLKTECMDPAAEAHFLKLLSDWTKDDDSSMEMLQELKGQGLRRQEVDLVDRILQLQMDEQDEPKKVTIFEGTVTREGLRLDLNEGAIHLTFPPNTVDKPTDIMVYRWKYGACLPQLMEHEAVVSNVIEISAAAEDRRLKFNSEVKLDLSHSAENLGGYELVMKRLTDTEKNEWEEIVKCEDIRQVSDIEDDDPCPKNVRYSFPVVQAGITKGSSYVVVSRLKLSPTYTITASGSTFFYPDYPQVTITIPENAVATETRFSLQLKVQEVPQDKFQGRGLFSGPILRVLCSSRATFLKPVTIQLPVSLGNKLVDIPQPSNCGVRIFFHSIEGETWQWVEISDRLENCASYDGKVVKFMVQGFIRFSAYAFIVDLPVAGSSSLLSCPLALSSIRWKQPLVANFFAYFDPDERVGSRDILFLICCPAHLSGGVKQDLERKNIAYEDTSRRHMIPGYDKAYVFVSGGVSAVSSDLESLPVYLRFDGNTTQKAQLQVCLINDKEHCKVEFRDTQETTENNLLSTLYLKFSSPSIYHQYLHS
ncbi:uncharacterized protein [Acropora muricata]|uniref:uncharacterized protein isoform X2 n=1 Tax=Acropora muricata TaxID=159855 RepID=UPI0034E52DDC